MAVTPIVELLFQKNLGNEDRVAEALTLELKRPFNPLRPQTEEEQTLHTSLGSRPTPNNSRRGKSQRSKGRGQGRNNNPVNEEREREGQPHDDSREEEKPGRYNNRRRGRGGRRNREARNVNDHICNTKFKKQKNYF